MRLWTVSCPIRMLGLRCDSGSAGQHCCLSCILKVFLMSCLYCLTLHHLHLCHYSDYLLLLLVNTLFLLSARLFLCFLFLFLIVTITFFALCLGLTSFLDCKQAKNSRIGWNLEDKLEINCPFVLPTAGPVVFVLCCWISLSTLLAFCWCDYLGLCYFSCSALVSRTHCFPACLKHLLLHAAF